MLTRRHFLKTLVVAAGSVGVSSLLEGCGGGGGTTDERAAFFPQSVASGDPRQHSVVLWTRVQDQSFPGVDANVLVQVATDEAFTALVVSEMVVAPGAHDNCLKVRITNLTAATTYYYRFVYNRISSHVGRTRTAADPGTDVAVKFACLNGNEFSGRYFNSYLQVLDEDLDFVCFLGNYVRETVANTVPPNVGDRWQVFSQPGEALSVGNADTGFLAASSISNYRDLYKTVKSDRLLQRVHERFPFVFIWDDHEFSDDCWGDNATYFDGAKVEADLQRRRNAEQACFEYMPIDTDSVAGSVAIDGSVIDVDSAARYPDTAIYRDFYFGANLHLIMTDYRTARPDHPIPEDAFPGTIVLDNSALSRRLDIDPVFVSDQYSRYVDLSLPEHDARRSQMQTKLRTAYGQALLARGLDATQMTADIDRWVSDATTKPTIVTDDTSSTGFNPASTAVNVAAVVINDYVDDALKFSDTDMLFMPLGMAYRDLFKTDLFSDIGSRGFVVRPAYDAYNNFLNTINNGAPAVLGSVQDKWLKDTVLKSSSTWKLVASPVSFAPAILDFSEPPLPFISPVYGNFIRGTEYARKFTFNVDHWDGFPFQRQHLLDDVLSPAGVVTVSGDLGAAVVTEHDGAGNGKRSIDFTVPAVSHATWADAVKATVSDINPALTSLVPFLDAAVVQATREDLRSGYRSHVRFSASDSQGALIMVASKNGLSAEYRLVAAHEKNGEVTSDVYATDYSVDDAAISDYRSMTVSRVFTVSLDGELSQLS